MLEGRPWINGAASATGPTGKGVRVTAPAVSIGLPVYDGERYLEAALDSVLSQTLTDLEVVVSDNASNDATREICEARARRDPRIRYVRQPSNRGAAWNYNETFRLARGRYFKWAPHDDLVAPTFLERCHAALEALPPSVVLAYPRMRLIDEAGESLGDYDAPIEWDPATPASRLRSLLCAPPDATHLHRCEPVMGLIRRDALARTRLIGGYNSADKVTIVELALLGDFHRIDDRLAFRREHAGSSQVANRSPDDMARWFDPTRRGRFVAPRSRLAVEYARAVLRADLPPGEKRRCLSVVGAYLRRNWRGLGGEIRNGLRTSVGLRGRA